MAKSSKAALSKAKPSVRVRDLEPERDPRGGLAVKNQTLKAGDQKLAHSGNEAGTLKE